MLDITIDELLAGKATSIKKKNYFPTAAYVEPFLERMHNLTSNFNVHVELPDQYTKTNDGGIDIDDITYNRVWVEGILGPEYSFDGHEGVIGMVYGLDVRKPVFKVYKGAIRSACTNLCVFNPELLKVQEIESDTAVDFRLVDSVIQEADDTRMWIDNIRNTPFTLTNLDESLGSWIRKTIDKSFDNGFGRVKLSPGDVIDAYKAMFVDEKSDYYIDITSDPSMFNVYNAFTQQITDNKRDIVNRVEKTLLVKSILGI